MAVRVSARQPVCHPNEPYMARGLCRRCYRAERLGLSPDAVGPSGNRGRRILDREWVPKLPPRIEGVHQHAMVDRPQACPKCKREWTLVFSGREAHCAGVRGGCGHTVYQVSERVMPYPTSGQIKLPSYDDGSED